MSNVFDDSLKQLCVNCIHKDDPLKECEYMLEHFKKTRECYKYRCCIPGDELNLDVQTDIFIAQFLNMENNSKI